MFVLVFVLPVVLAILVLIKPIRSLNIMALLGSSACVLVGGFGTWLGYFPGQRQTWLDGYFSLDHIGLLFLLILAVVFAGSAVYSLSYFSEHKLSLRRQSHYTAAMLLFVAAMIGVILANHLALLWVLVEATTLSSAVLINFENQKPALEAAWKYLFICSVGIALAFVGIIMLSMGSKAVGTLFFTDLYAHAGQINPFWLKMSFVFILVGFGTKIGVAPLHAWLPDAHSEAPSPISALLSGTLLNTAFLGLFRVHKILLQAGAGDFANHLILITGFLSLFVSAVFMMGIKNYKRMLAYSSIENMGILFIGMTLGAPGIFAAMLHTAAHSFSKAALFLTSGNILNLYKTKQIDDVQGIVCRDPRTGWLWFFSALAIAGFPPFPTFLSKFLIVQAFFAQGAGVLAAVFFLIVVFVIYGIMRAVFGMTFPGSHSPIEVLPTQLGWSAYLPQISFLVLLTSLGVSLPKQVLLLLQQATHFFPVG